jgi:hypothetical protein
MTDTVTSQNIVLSSWDTLCIYIYIYIYIKLTYILRKNREKTLSDKEEHQWLLRVQHWRDHYSLNHLCWPVNGFIWWISHQSKIEFRSKKIRKKKYYFLSHRITLCVEISCCCFRPPNTPWSLHCVHCATWFVAQCWWENLDEGKMQLYQRSASVAELSFSQRFHNFI